MSIMSRFAVALMVLVGLACLVPYGRADEQNAENVAAERENAQASREQRIRTTLHDPTRLEFVDTPLSDVMQYLSDLHDLPIVIDYTALDDVGIGADQPVTLNVEGLSLRSALKLLLDPLELVYAVQNEVLLITTADEQPYYVQGYLMGNGAADAWVDAFQMVAPQSWDEVGGAGEIQIVNNLLLVSQTEYVHEQLVDVHTMLLRAQPEQAPAEAARPATSETADKAGELKIYQGVPPEVAVAVVSVVHPDKWRAKTSGATTDGEGTMALVGDRMLVYQTPEVHQAINELLKKLSAEGELAAGGGGFGGAGSGQF